MNATVFSRNSAAQKSGLQSQSRHQEAGKPPLFGERMIRFMHATLFSVGLIATGVLLGAWNEHGSLGFLKLDFAETQVKTEVMVEQDEELRQANDLLAREMQEAIDEKLRLEMAGVRDFIARRYRVSPLALEPVLDAAMHTGRDLGVDPMLIVAIMAIESSFNPLAESHMGAQGLMQIIPRWHMDKIGADAPEDALFDPSINIRVGTEVLKEGLRRYGSMQSALQYYNGALSDPAARYAQRVMSLKARLKAVGRETRAQATAGAPSA